MKNPADRYNVRVKKDFFVVYDYGEGGVWAFVAARSGKEIERCFPTSRS